jgi:hypothetical protein
MVETGAPPSSPSQAAHGSFRYHPPAHSASEEVFAKIINAPSNAGYRAAQIHQVISHLIDNETLRLVRDELIQERTLRSEAQSELHDSKALALETATALNREIGGANQRTADLQRQFDEYKLRMESKITLHQRIDALASQLTGMSVQPTAPQVAVATCSWYCFQFGSVPKCFGFYVPCVAAITRAETPFFGS